MIADTTLLVNVAMISLAALGMQIFMRRFSDISWIAIHVTIIATAVAAYLHHWQGFGFLLLAVFLILVAAPVALSVLGNRLSRSARGVMAAHVWRLAALLHPSAQWRFHAAMMAATSAPTLAEQCIALERLERKSSGHWATRARMTRLRFAGAWEELLALHHEQGPLADDPLYRVYHITALGHVGRLEEMASLYLHSRDGLETAALRDEPLASVLMSSGKYRILEALLSKGGFGAWTMSDANRRWIQGYARLVAGQEDMRPLLYAFADEMPDAMIRGQMRQRLEAVFPGRPALSEELSRRIDQDAEARLAALDADTRGKKAPVATFCLLATMILGYGWQLLLGDPVSTRLLVRAGGMWPPYVANGEWWRLATALFLHSGWLHIGFNLVALYVLGSAVEQRAGWRRMLVIYGLGGVLSSLAVYGAMVSGLASKAVLVGASGAVMALLGALTLFVALDRIGKRTKENSALFKAILAVIALQVVADFLIPDVSFVAHLGGFAAGIGISAIFILFRR